MKVGLKKLATGADLPLPHYATPGLALNHGITCLNSPGTIDSDYRGEIKVILINHSDTVFKITRGMKIAQMVIARHEQAELAEVESLSESERGAGGFGSTGMKPSLIKDGA